MLIELSVPQICMTCIGFVMQLMQPNVIKHASQTGSNKCNGMRTLRMSPKATMDNKNNMH